MFARSFTIQYKHLFLVKIKVILSVGIRILTGFFLEMSDPDPYTYIRCSDRDPQPGLWQVTLFLYRRRGDVFEPWLRQPTFLKTVQGEDVWIETYLKENRCKEAGG